MLLNKLLSLISHFIILPLIYFPLLLRQTKVPSKCVGIWRSLFEWHGSVIVYILLLNGFHLLAFFLVRCVFLLAWASGDESLDFSTVLNSGDLFNSVSVCVVSYFHL
jgi:hypothetical protein